MPDTCVFHLVAGVQASAASIVAADLLMAETGTVRLLLLLLLRQRRPSQSEVIQAIFPSGRSSSHTVVVVDAVVVAIIGGGSETCRDESGRGSTVAIIQG